MPYNNIKLIRKNENPYFREEENIKIYTLGKIIHEMQIISFLHLGIVFFSFLKIKNNELMIRKIYIIHINIFIIRLLIHIL